VLRCCLCQSTPPPAISLFHTPHTMPCNCSAKARVSRWGILVGVGGLLWLLVLGLACWFNSMDPLPIPRKVAHPLRAFDGVFRVAGPLLPFCVAVPRAFVPLPASRCVTLTFPWLPPASLRPSHRQQQQHRRSTKRAMVLGAEGGGRLEGRHAFHHT